MTQQTNAPMTANPQELKPEDYQAALDDIYYADSYEAGVDYLDRHYNAIESALHRAAETPPTVEVHTDGVAVLGSSPVCKSRARRVGDIAVDDEATSATPSVCTELDAAIFDWENVEGPDFGATSINTGILRKFIQAAKAHRNTQPQVLKTQGKQGT